MAIKTYLYQAAGVTTASLTPLLAMGAAPVVGAPLNETLVPITIDDSHKADLDDAMGSLGYLYIREYVGGVPIVAREDYGVLTANPVGAVPGPGDYYYNSSIQMEMKYDSLRGKWLSVDSTRFTFGRNQNTQPGQYYYTVDGRVMSAALGWYAMRSGTVVALSYTRSDVDAADFEVTANGVTIASVASAAVGGRDITLDADFNFGQVLAARNGAAGNATRHVVASIWVKWRS